MQTIWGKPPKKYKKKWGIIVAQAGDSLVLDEVTNGIATLLQEKILPDESNPSKRLNQFRTEIGDIAHDVFDKYQRRALDNPPHFELLFGAADKSSTLLYVTSDGKQQILDNSGIIGQGRITGGELLLNEFLKEGLTQKQAARLAALVITRIGTVDMSVSGIPEIKWCRNRRVWHYTEKSFKKIMKESNSQWNALKKSWWSD